jgi:hypothetical protein
MHLEEPEQRAYCLLRFLKFKTRDNIDRYHNIMYLAVRAIPPRAGLLRFLKFKTQDNINRYQNMYLAVRFIG